MKSDAEVDESVVHAAPGARMVLEDGSRSGKVEIDLLVRPTDSKIGCGADRCGSPTDHDHRRRDGDRLVMRVELGVDLLVRLEPGLAPESVGHAGRDYEDVVPLDGDAAVSKCHGDLPRIEVDTGQQPVHPAHAVEPSIATEGDPVVAGPVIRPRQPHSEFLPAHQFGFSRDPDHVGMPGQVDRGEDADVTQSRDENPWQCVGHVTGLGRNRGTGTSMAGCSQPPSTCSNLPVTHADAGEARYKAAQAMSFGVPGLPIGVLASN